jgi:hypothetical protein
MMMASTPSLNASSRFFSMRDHNGARAAAQMHARESSPYSIVAAFLSITPTGR